MSGKRKGTYKITNWRKYNEALVNRGSLTLWLDEESLAAWNHANAGVRRGRPFVYSDAAVECLLTLREVFRLPYRQTEGLARSVIALMGLKIDVPDYSSLAKRAGKLKVDLKRVRRGGPIDLVVDSTGLKVFGEGEWKVRLYGVRKHRTWRKLHLAINSKTQEIEATVVSTNGHDSQHAEALLKQVARPFRSFRGDAAYDKWHVYDLLSERGAVGFIPPQKNARIKQHGNCQAPPLARDETLRRIHRIGRARWKREVGYHRRSLAETAMFRIKRAFGRELKNRLLENQTTEGLLRAKALNKITNLGMPKFEWM